MVTASGRFKHFWVGILQKSNPEQRIGSAALGRIAAQDTYGQPLKKPQTAYISNRRASLRSAEASAHPGVDDQRHTVGNTQSASLDTSTFCQQLDAFRKLLNVASLVDWTVVGGAFRNIIDRRNSHEQEMSKSHGHDGHQRESIALDELTDAVRRLSCSTLSEQRAVPITDATAGTQAVQAREPNEESDKSW